VAYRALLVANWEYADPGKALGPLNGPRNDLKVMRKALTDQQFGLFEVATEQNLTWAKMRGAFSDFLAGAEPQDRLLIYFSGHGERLGDGRLALCGVDTEYAKLGATTFDTKELREWIETANRSPSTVVVLDCCYSGAFKDAGPSEADLQRSLGAGTIALCSGGSQPTRDALSEDDASPFTAALATILADPGVPGDADGFLTVDEVYRRLLAYTPPLQPKPKRNEQSQGMFPLALRAKPAGRERDDLKGFEKPDVEAIELRFSRACVHVEADSTEAEDLDLDHFDECRQSAVLGLIQLTDAILCASEYDADEWAQRAVRQAWSCIGSNLFETTLPPAVRRRIHAVGQPGGKLLKLRLSFDDAKQEAYPWEFLYRERDDGNTDDGVEPQPLALAPGLLLERVVRQEGAAAPETQVTGPYTVGLVGSHRATLGDATAKVADGLTAMPGLNVVFDLRGSAARWGEFLDALDQGPDLLVVSAPVRRRAKGGADIGFWSDDPADAEWHPVQDLISEFHWRKRRFRAVVFTTFAARPGQDSFRATSELACQLARALIGPVVFICHAPGYAAHVKPLAPDTLPLLFVDAFTRGERFDHAVYYAKNRVARFGSQQLRRTFGVPGYYVIEQAGAPAADAPSPGPRRSGILAGASARPPGKEPKPA
jgi:hypothetical protein